jgi:glutamate-ammonia-ligase adenylyltransferase
MADAALLTPELAAELIEAHTTLLAASLSCTLDRRPRLTAPTPAIASARVRITRACAALGLEFPGGRDAEG